MATCTYSSGMSLELNSLGRWVSLSNFVSLITPSLKFNELEGVSQGVIEDLSIISPSMLVSMFLSGCCQYIGYSLEETGLMILDYVGLALCQIDRVIMPYINELHQKLNLFLENGSILVWASAMCNGPEFIFNFDYIE